MFIYVCLRQGVTYCPFIELLKGKGWNKGFETLASGSGNNKKTQLAEFPLAKTQPQMKQSFKMKQALACSCFFPCCPFLWQERCNLPLH